MAIMIEVLNKQHKVIERHKFKQDVVRLGRAYDNDLVLFDKHVSPHHAELSKTQDGSWQLKDLASLNGSALAQGEPIHVETALVSGELCWLGQQALRIYDENHPVPPAQPYNQLEQKLSRFGHWPLMTMLLLLVLLSEVFSMWLDVPNPERNEWPRLLVGLPLLVLVLMIWPSLLALWAKINQHEARFFAQVGITFAAVVLIQLLNSVFAVLNFSLDGHAVFHWLEEISSILVIVGMLTANFYLALQISTTRKVLLASAIGGVILLQSFSDTLLTNDYHQRMPSFDSQLLPLSFYFNEPQTSTEFEAGNRELFEQVNLLKEQQTAENENDSTGG